MVEWFNLSEDERKIIINQVSIKKGLLPTAIEKDWWVMIALRAIFKTKYSDYLLFKGGTSLSKSYNLIERFSEDIDLALDRSFFNLEGNLTKSQVRNLRKKSAKFVCEVFIHELEKELLENNVKDFELSIVNFEESDTDPISIELRYKSLTETIPYLQPRILIEISSRSLRNPFENREVISFIDEVYPNLPFSNKPISVPTVLPTRTFLEKIFLLHEEFQKPDENKIRHERMTRHLYDISKLMDSNYSQQALNNTELYQTIVNHREMITNLPWVDYTKHNTKTLNFIPSEKIIENWRKDYKDMQESMFYGKTDSFDKLIMKLTELNREINNK
ncbi:nucleotidyl transferase AbiEii/AbiGii toxin family protein [Flavobacterium sp.]|uniref:nucleotidyl transferase AbiEii/AbiGii toxin family protein n=1 Tax=Flavobacterium sp. TaxID=239 RepID=UPI002624EC84|nr:nucleotidyl transferase AbiEii/AbiGii toxin family protein [Flavobacterium sp.]